MTSQEADFYNHVLLLLNARGSEQETWCLKMLIFFVLLATFDCCMQGIAAVVETCE